MDALLWGLLGYVLFPLWLLAGLVDYWTHQRTGLAVTAGVRESILHLLQTLQVGIPVLVVLFLELTLAALAVVVACAMAHTITAYVDVRYASSRRTILPLEQMVHAALVTLPLFATAVLVILHWPAVNTPSGLLADAAGYPQLRWRDRPWEPVLVATVLVASVLFGLLPALAEFRQALRAGREVPGSG